MSISTQADLDRAQVVRQACASAGHRVLPYVCDDCIAAALAQAREEAINGEHDCMASRLLESGSRPAAHVFKDLDERKAEREEAFVVGRLAGIEEAAKFRSLVQTLIRAIDRARDLNPGDEEAEWLQPFAIFKPALSSVKRALAREPQK